MTNPPNRGRTPRVLLEWTGRSFVAAFPDGVKLTTGDAYPGCAAVWIVGHGDRARRQQIMASRGAPYTYHHDRDQMAKHFAHQLGARIVEDVDAAATEVWGVETLTWA